jgi:hypothetical protein
MMREPWNQCADWGKLYAPLVTICDLKMTTFWDISPCSLVRAIPWWWKQQARVQTTQCNNAWDNHLHTRRRENQKSHLVNPCGEAAPRCVRIFEALTHAASTSETSVNFYQTTRLNNPEDSQSSQAYDADAWTVGGPGQLFTLHIR